MRYDHGPSIIDGRTPMQRVAPGLSQSLALCLCLMASWGCTRQTPSISQPNQAAIETAETTLSPELAKADVATLEPPATPALNEQVAENSASSPVAQTAWLPSGDWTTRRLIALAETGPIVIDLSVSVGQLSLREANDQLLTLTAAELLKQPTSASSLETAEPTDATVAAAQVAAPQPAISWEQLLALPLVQSGWLGNLVASEEQTAQLIAQYDSDRDGSVGEAELRMFLSRGLARATPLQVDDIGQAPDRQPNASPWGSGDPNDDHVIDADERDRFAETLATRDLNADGVVTPAEWTEFRDTGMQMTMLNGGSRNSFLRNQTLLQFDSAEDDTASDNMAHTSPQKEAAATNKAARKLASDVLRHYTFLAELSRSQWPGWSDAQWQVIDANQNQAIDVTELLQLASLPAQAHLYLRWPGLEHSAAAGMSSDNSAGESNSAGDTLQVHALTAAPNASWHARSGGGTLLCGDCSLSIDALDGFSTSGKQLWRQQFSQALQNPQFKTLLASRLELQPDAFDLLDADDDQMLNEAEFERAWQWLSVRQSARVVAQWMLSSQPAFQLLDGDGDRRLAQPELARIATRLAELDRDGDGSVAPNELPLVVSLSVRRTDRRLEAFSMAGPSGAPIVDSDWFSAMDVNRDANISAQEFLGEPSDFERFDANRDGFVTRQEALAASPSDGTK